MNQQKYNITDSEWEVMRVIWSQKETTSHEIISILQPKVHWQPTTIKTLIARLVKKGLVAACKESNRYIYSAKVTETQIWQSVSSALFYHICARKMGKKIAELINDNPLSFEDIELIRNAITAKETYAVKEVICNCIPGQCACNDSCCST